MKTKSNTFWFAARAAVLLCAPALASAQFAMVFPPEQADPPEPPEVAKVLQFSMGGTFLGVGVREVDTERARALKLKDEYGVEITRVEDDSPASKAGLKVGDVVLEYNGQRVEGTTQFVRLVQETPAGRVVKLLVGRNGSTHTIPATLATRKKNMPTHLVMPDMSHAFEMPQMPDIPKAMMSWRSPMLGIDAESITDSQLGSYFGVKEGVLVRSVAKGAPGEKAGLKPGDVLLKVDETKVLSPRDVTSALRAALGSKKTVAVVLTREKREMTVAVAFDEEAPRSTSVVRPRGRMVVFAPQD
jgi:serine protease Do